MPSMKITGFGPLPEEKVKELETAVGTKLPTAYREFLEKTGGGIVTQDKSNRIRLPAIGKEIAVDVFFGYGVTANSDVLYWNREYSDELIDDAVLIGCDVLGGFLFILASDETGLYYWDDSYNFKESDDRQNVYCLEDNLHTVLSSVVS